MKKLLALVLLLGFAAAAQAFEIKAKSDNPQFSEDALRGAVQQAATSIGSRIPDDPNIKVYIYSRRLQAKDGQFLYLHRIQLRKAFAGKAPYAYRGWLPIESIERYGIDNPEGSRAALDELLREFFTKFKSVDPNQDFE